MALRETERQTARERRKRRVLLVYRDRLLCDVVSVLLSDQPDIEVVERLRVEDFDPVLLDTYQPDVVVADRASPEWVQRLLDELVQRRPRAGLILVNLDRSHLTVYQGRCHINAGADDLLAAVRDLEAASRGSINHG